MSCSSPSATALFTLSVYSQAVIPKIGMVPYPCTMSCQFYNPQFSANCIHSFLSQDPTISPTDLLSAYSLSASGCNYLTAGWLLQLLTPATSSHRWHEVALLQCQSLTGSAFLWFSLSDSSLPLASLPTAPRLTPLLASSLDSPCLSAAAPPLTPFQAWGHVKSISTCFHLSVLIANS